MTDFEPPKDGTTTPETPSEPRPPVDGGGTATKALDPYEILGLSNEASQADIEDAYQRFARYPDLWIGTGPERQQRLVNIQAAHELLSDPARRAEYDDAVAHDARMARRDANRRPGWNPRRPDDAQPAAAVANRPSTGPYHRRRGLDRARAQGMVVNPYRIPSSSMEPTLHCARPGFDCLAHSPTASSPAASASASATRSAATSSSSTHRPRPTRSAVKAGRS